MFIRTRYSSWRCVYSYDSQHDRANCVLRQYNKLKISKERLWNERVGRTLSGLPVDNHETVVVGIADEYV